MSDGLAARLVDLVGAANVIDDAAERAYYAHDIAGPAPHAPELVVRSPSVDATVACVAAITDAGHALTVRGGGHSYTGGYGPTRPGTVILDMSALDRVVEINEADGWVTTEAGCTWRTLHDALAAVGRRNPVLRPALRYRRNSRRRCVSERRVLRLGAARPDVGERAGPRRGDGRRHPDAARERRR